MPDTHECECGNFQTKDGDHLTCDGETMRTFQAGHDARLKSFLIRHGAIGNEIFRSQDGALIGKSAIEWASSFGFGYQVTAGIKRAQDKAAAAAQREIVKANALVDRIEAKNTARAEKAQAKAHVLASRAVVKAEKAAAKKHATASQIESAISAGESAAAGDEVVQAKVGRHFYYGTVEGKLFFYRDAKGAPKSTPTFQVL